jgi:RES domain-containing protein
MDLFRIISEKYADDLSGTGAKLVGGRWNSKGSPVIYCSENRALALLENLVRTPLTLLKSDLMIITIHVPDEIKAVKSILVKGHADYPASAETKKEGDWWVKKGKSLLIKVPSAIIPHEYNYLINPSHKDILKIKISHKEKLKIDSRLLTV